MSMIVRRAVLGSAGAAIAAFPLLLPGSAGAPKSRPPTTHVISMKKMKFDPAPADLRVGDAIEWVNEDIFLHTATAKDKSFDVVLKPKAKGKILLEKAGDIAFICRYHPRMKGVLHVAPMA